MVGVGTVGPGRPQSTASPTLNQSGHCVRSEQPGGILDRWVAEGNQTSSMSKDFTLMFDFILFGLVFIICTCIYNSTYNLDLETYKM